VKATCPKCGSPAKFVSQKPYTTDFSEVFFKCENPKCGGDVVAEVTFAMRKAPANQHFSASIGRKITDC